MTYLWEKKQWPDLKWDEGHHSNLLATVSHEQGRLLGRMEGLGYELQKEVHLRTLTEEVIKSSEIEGEHLDADQVRSSIARRLGMNLTGLVPADRDVEGIVEMMLDATENFDEPLTEGRLHDWHAALFPTGRSGMVRIIAGAWRDDRDGPMQVVSGPMGRETVHYEATPADRIADEMARFLAWFADPGDAHPVLVAAMAHLRFVTIHPFDDGNGRIARAIAELGLARSQMTPQRYYSMSSQIRAEREDYYHVLERTQTGDMDVTHWLEWFLGCLHRAIESSAQTLDAVMAKARFWDQFAKEPLNRRQIKVLDKLLDGFEGKLTSSKWARIAKCSQDTASRDINDLIERAVLKKDPGGGRSTSYSIMDQ
ncbi:MAG: Fic family protein [Gammaproteobacteria bacterium]|nr:Fic family protein [Gammaproteobacteria bacterium]